MMKKYLAPYLLLLSSVAFAVPLYFLTPIKRGATPLVAIGDTRSSNFVQATPSYLSLGDNLRINLSTVVSWSFWFKPTTIAGGVHTLIGKVNGSNTGYYTWLNANGAIEYIVSNTFGSNYLRVATPNTTIVAGNWYHIVTTNDGSANASNMHVYVNAVDQTLTVVGNNLVGSPNSNGDLQFGNDQTGDPTDGSMDEVGYFTKVLSQAEVTNIYASGNPFDLRTATAAANLTHYWRLGEGDNATSAGGYLDSVGAITGTGTGTPTITTDVPAWTPLTEGGALFDYEAFVLSSITKNGSNQVSQWNDQGPNSGNATQVTTARMPVYSAGTGPNSTDVLQFIDSEMLPYNSFSQQLLNKTRGHTICFALKMRAFRSGANTFLNLNDNTGTAPPSILYRNAQNSFEFNGNGSNWFSMKFTVPSNTSAPHKFCYVYNGAGSTTSTNFVFYYDTNTPVAAGTQSNGNGNGTVIGNYLNGSDASWDANSDVSGMYMFDHEFSATGVQVWMNYILRKLNY